MDRVDPAESAEPGLGTVGDDGVAALRALPAAAVEDAVRRATLYACAKLRTRTHAEPSLDPANLALSALEDTLAGRRRWQPRARPLLRHLAMTIDSHVSHFLDSPRAWRLRAAEASEAREAALASPGPTPEESASGADAVRDLEAFVAARQASLAPLLALVTREGLALGETDTVMQALGLDPGNNADRQRAYRQIRALRALTRAWCEHAEASADSSEASS